MVEENESPKEIIVRPAYETVLHELETHLLKVLSSYGLPTEDIFAPIEERASVFKNIDTVVARIVLFMYRNLHQL